MDSPPLSLALTPPSRRSDARLRSKPAASCLADEPDADADCPALTPRPSMTRPSISPSPLHLSGQNDASDLLPLRELLLLSPSPSPRRRPRARKLRLDLDNVDPDFAPPRRSKSRSSRSLAAAANASLMICGSPRQPRKSRRRAEKENAREERDLSFYEEEVVKVRRPSRRSRPAAARKEKPSLDAPVTSSDPCPKVIEEEDSNGMRGACRVVSETIMWKDAAKSTLWFGLGSLCFLSSCFSKNISFNAFSAVSHVSLFILIVAFFHDSFLRRCDEKQKVQLKLKEDDILRAARLVLPTINATIAILQDVFSGRPSMTIKVAPVLLITAKYGHLITLWRLCAIGFFTSFTIPKLYSCYSGLVQRQVENIILHVSEAWRACRHKKIVASFSGMAFWNLFSFKTRVFIVFIAIVIFRYHHQRDEGEICEADEGKVEVRDQALVAEGNRDEVQEESNKKKS